MYFPIFNDYVYAIIRIMINKYKPTSPFLEVGCGTGRTLKFLGDLGYEGLGIDASQDALEIARSNLADYPRINIQPGSLFDIQGNYKLLLAIDVLEHIEDDIVALQKIMELLVEDGMVIILVPQGADEFYWDDIEFGHYRRYSREELVDKIRESGLEPMEVLSIGFPFFWLARHIIVRLFKGCKSRDTMEVKTARSSYEHPYAGSRLVALLGEITRSKVISWPLIKILLFQRLFEDRDRGHSLLVVAKRSRS